MGTARLQIPASGENGERERILVQLFFLFFSFRFGEGKADIEQRRTLSKRERKSYLDAVLCLQKKPTLYKEIVGAKSRFDDFQLVHIDQSFDIHFNVSLFI